MLFPKIGGWILPPKMDGLFHGKAYEEMDDLGVFPLFLETPYISCMFGRVHDHDTSREGV